jgi:Flp pilus assembly protein TadG
MGPVARRVAGGRSRALLGTQPESGRGQAVTEFAIMVPLLMVILLAVADFGRVFQAAIVMHSAGRAAAEAAAIEYRRTEEARNALAPGAEAAYFERIHAVASTAACQEARVLGNTTYVEGPPVACATWPAIAVCVHDANKVDPACGTPSTGFTAGPAECSSLRDPWATNEDVQAHDYVEVRVCYRFTTLFNLNFTLPMGAGISIGDIYLQNAGAFIVADY